MLHIWSPLIDRRDSAPARPVPGALTSIGRNRTSLVLTGVVNMELERVPPRASLDRERMSQRERGALCAFQPDIAAVVPRVAMLGDSPRTTTPARQVTNTIDRSSQNARNDNSSALTHCFLPPVASELSTDCARTRTHFSPQRRHSLRSLTGTLCTCRSVHQFKKFSPILTN